MANSHAKCEIEVDSILPGAVISPDTISKTSYPAKNTPSSVLAKNTKPQLLHGRCRKQKTVNTLHIPTSGYISTVTSQRLNNANKPSEAKISFEESMRMTLEKSALLMRNTLLLKEPVVYKYVSPETKVKGSQSCLELKELPQHLSPRNTDCETRSTSSENESKTNSSSSDDDRGSIAVSSSSDESSSDGRSAGDNRHNKVNPRTQVQPVKPKLKQSRHINRFISKFVVKKKVPVKTKSLLSKKPSKEKGKHDKASPRIEANIIRIPIADNYVKSKRNKEPPISISNIISYKPPIVKSKFANFMDLPIPTYFSKYPPRRKSPRKKRKPAPIVPEKKICEVDIEIFQEMRCNSEVDYESCLMDIRACGHVVTAMERMDMRENRKRNKFSGITNLVGSTEEKDYSYRNNNESII